MPAETILYIEDDKDDAYLFTLRMQRFGYKINVANSVSDGVARFDPEIHAIVVTDWNLPDGEAPDVIRGLQAQEPGIPIFIISSCFKDKHLEEAEKLGAAKCITKTVQEDYLSELHDTIKGRNY